MIYVAVFIVPEPIHQARNKILDYNTVGISHATVMHVSPCRVSLQSILKTATARMEQNLPPTS